MRNRSQNVSHDQSPYVKSESRNAGGLVSSFEHYGANARRGERQHGVPASLDQNVNYETRMSELTKQQMFTNLLVGDKLQPASQMDAYSSSQRSLVLKRQKDFRKAKELYAPKSNLISSQQRKKRLQESPMRLRRNIVDSVWRGPSSE